MQQEDLEETFKFNVEKIKEKDEKIISLQNDIENGIQRYPRKNEDIIPLAKLREFQLIYDLLCAKYSYGMDCEELEEIYLKGVDVVRDIGYERSFLYNSNIGNSKKEG